MNKEKLENFLIFDFYKMPYKLKEFSILQYASFIFKEKGIENYSISIDKLNSNIDGYCIPKSNLPEYSQKIVLNKSNIDNNNVLALIKTIYHESMHAIQNNLLEMSKNSQFCENMYLKRLDYCKNKVDIDINFCNFKFRNVSLHIRQASNNVSDYNEKSSIFYHLNISEREAFLEEERVSLFFQKKYNICEKNKYCISKNVDNFNRLYHCNLSKEEVFDVIDQCYENLVEHKNPSHTEEGNLVATVMYDVCLVAGYNSGLLNEKEVQKLSTLQAKQQILAKEDYLVYGIKSDKNIFLSKKEQEEFVKNPELLETLSKIEQNLNPVLIWNVISKNRNKGADFFNGLLKDKNSFFKQIVKNETSREMCEECLSALFGKEFEVCLNKYKKQKNTKASDDFSYNGNEIVRDILEEKEDYER